VTGTPNTYLVRYSSTGQYIWDKYINAGSQNNGRSVALDGSGNIYLAGTTQGPIDLGGGLLPFTSVPTAAYVAKFTSTGSPVWSKSLNTVLGINASSMAVDHSGNIAVTGNFNGTVDFGNGPLLGNGQSGYVVKFNSTNGGAVWSKAFVASAYYPGGNSSCGGVGVAFDGVGNVVVTGQFWEKCNFGGGDLITPSSGTGNGFLAKYAAATGAYMSASQFGGTGNDLGNSVTVDANGNSIVTGTTNGGNFNGATLTSNGGYDAFIMKVTP